MSRPEPCDVGDHYSCERARCRCACHPRSGRPRKAATPVPITSPLSGVTWQADRNDPQDAA